MDCSFQRKLGAVSGIFRGREGEGGLPRFIYGYVSIANFAVFRQLAPSNFMSRLLGSTSKLTKLTPVKRILRLGVEKPKAVRPFVGLPLGFFIMRVEFPLPRPSLDKVGKFDFYSCHDGCVNCQLVNVKFWKLNLECLFFLGNS